MSALSSRSTFDHQLTAVRNNVLRMSGLVNRSIERAVTAFQRHDLLLARQIIESDSEINRLRYDIERDINAAMALHAPLARDLRSLLASFSITTELERMGDYAEGIARTIARYPEADGEQPPIQIPQMTAHVRRMLLDALDAYAEENIEKAEATARMDDSVDGLYRDLFDVVVKQMSQGELVVERGTYLLWVGHNLERMGDRVTNICERVLFTQTGTIEREMNPKGEHAEPPIQH